MELFISWQIFCRYLGGGDGVVVDDEPQSLIRKQQRHQSSHGNGQICKYVTCNHANDVDDMLCQYLSVNIISSVIPFEICGNLDSIYD